MRKVIKREGGDKVSFFLTLSLLIPSNNHCYLSSHVLGVGTGCLCAGRQYPGDSSMSLGDSLNLMAAHRRKTLNIGIRQQKQKLAEPRPKQYQDSTVVTTSSRTQQ
jgi:hypothetical protein